MKKKKLKKQIARLDRKLDQIMNDVRWLRDLVTSQVPEEEQEVPSEEEQEVLAQEDYVPVVNPGTNT